MVLGSGVVPPASWSSLTVPISNLPFGTAVHIQAATLPPSLPALPYTMSPVASGTFYY